MAWRNGHAVRVLRFAWLPLLDGCSQKGYWLLHPKGVIARTEWHTTVLDVVVMGVVVLVAGGLVVAFLWRYRAGNTLRRYDPTFTASLVLEILVWGVPLLVVGYLSYFSVKSVFATNPYDPLSLRHALVRPHQADQGLAHRASPARARTTVPGAQEAQPLHVEVVTTDWQWVFIYPQQGIATVDDLVVPVGARVKFDLTSATVVNDFFIPELVGEIDIMPGMRTKQAMIANDTGVYHGYSDDFSGGGFSWMGFDVRVTDHAEFRKWVRRVRAAPDVLSYARFGQIARPTINVAQRVSYFSQVQKGLFDHVIERVMAGKVYRTPLAMTENMTKPMKVRLIP